MKIALALRVLFYKTFLDLRKVSRDMNKGALSGANLSLNQVDEKQVLKGALDKNKLSCEASFHQPKQRQICPSP